MMPNDAHPKDLKELEAIQDLELMLGQAIPAYDFFYGIAQEGMELDSSRTHVIKLMLVARDLRSLPQSFTFLTRLQYLDLSENQLTSLSDDFGNLRQLQQLYLKDNQLATLPPSFGNLQELQVLDLENNQFSSIPPILSRLVNLRTLKLKGNPIQIADLSPLFLLPRLTEVILPESTKKVMADKSFRHVDRPIWAENLTIKFKKLHDVSDRVKAILSGQVVMPASEFLQQLQVPLLPETVLETNQEIEAFLQARGHQVAVIGTHVFQISLLRKLITTRLKEQGWIDLQMLSRELRVSHPLLEKAIEDHILNGKKMIKGLQRQGRILYLEDHLTSHLNVSLKTRGWILLTPAALMKSDTSTSDTQLDDLQIVLDRIVTQRLKGKIWKRMMINEKIIRKRMLHVIKQQQLLNLEQLQQALQLPRDSLDFLSQEIDHLFRKKKLKGYRIGDVISTWDGNQLMKVMNQLSKKWKQLRARLWYLQDSRQSLSKKELRELLDLQERLTALEQIFMAQENEIGQRGVQSMLMEIHEVLQALNE